jgi:hypothetical protein
MKKTATPSLLACFFLASCTLPSDTLHVARIESPASSNSGEPHLHTAPDGNVFLSWVEKGDDISSLKYSRLNGYEWSEPVLIAEGSNWFVNWADYPMMSSNDSVLMALYLEKNGEGKFAYATKVTHSDNGKDWTTAAVLHDDGKQSQHGFLAIEPYAGDFLITWLDGRNTVMEGHEDHMGSMTLRAAVVNKLGQKINEWELDNRTCDCCQTDIAITNNGPVVVYRDRGEDEVRDMSVVRFVDGHWTEPATVHKDNWKIKGCPVNGPRISAIGNNLAVAWFSVIDSKPQVNVAFSSDGGETFQNPIRMNENPTVGRVDIVMIDEQTAWVSWMEGNTIKAASADSKGNKGKSIIVAESSESRAGGFPQMTLAGSKLVFAWTDDQTKTIKTVFKEM